MWTCCTWRFVWEVEFCAIQSDLHQCPLLFQCYWTQKQTRFPMVLGWHCHVPEEKPSAVDLWVGSCGARREAVMLSPAFVACLPSWDLFSTIVLVWTVLRHWEMSENGWLPLMVGAVHGAGWRSSRYSGGGYRASLTSHSSTYGLLWALLSHLPSSSLLW